MSSRLPRLHRIGTSLAYSASTSMQLQGSGGANRQWASDLFVAFLALQVEGLGHGVDRVSILDHRRGLARAPWQPLGVELPRPASLLFGPLLSLLLCCLRRLPAGTMHGPMSGYPLTIISQ